MFDIKDLYQEIIVDHNRSPRNFGVIDDADKILEGFNPLCGDKLKFRMILIIWKLNLLTPGLTLKSGQDT